MKLCVCVCVCGGTDVCVKLSFLPEGRTEQSRTERVLEQIFEKDQCYTTCFFQNTLRVDLIAVGSFKCYRTLPSSGFLLTLQRGLCCFLCWLYHRTVLLFIRH